MSTAFLRLKKSQTHTLTFLRKNNFDQKGYLWRGSVEECEGLFPFKCGQIMCKEKGEIPQCEAKHFLHVCGYKRHRRRRDALLCYMCCTVTNPPLGQPLVPQPPHVKYLSLYVMSHTGTHCGPPRTLWSLSRLVSLQIADEE